MSFFYVFILVKKYFSYSNANKNIPQEGKKMQTSKAFKENLKNKIITKEMLNQALYSVNKRAKNYRDKAWDYSFYGGAYYEIAREKKEECYRIKERGLTSPFFYSTDNLTQNSTVSPCSSTVQQPLFSPSTAPA